MTIGLVIGLARAPNGRAILATLDLACRVVGGGNIALGDRMSVIREVTKKKVFLPG